MIPNTEISNTVIPDAVTPVTVIPETVIPATVIPKLQTPKTVTTKTVSNLFAASLAALACSVGALRAQDAIKDNIVTTSGKRIRGVEVTEASSTTVKYKLRNEESELPTASLSSIEWSMTPESYRLAKAAADRGQFANAANLYSEAASKAERDVVKLDANFLAAQALVRSAGSDAQRAGEAVSALESFLSEASDSFRGAEATLELGQAQLLAGQAAAAEQTMSKLSNLVISQGLDPLWDVRAKFAIAKAQLAQSKLADARTAFRRAKSAADNLVATSETPNPAAMALVAESVVGEGETFVAEKKFGDALTYFERFTKDKNPNIAAAAKAGLGEALFLQAEETGDAKGLRRAQIVLAEANLDDPLAGPTTAKALYYGGKVIMALGADRESSDFAARAQSYFKAVVQQHAGTRWAALAAQNKR